MSETRFGTFEELMAETPAPLLPYTAWVNLGFYQGLQLPDPGGLLEGTGAKLRHVKVRSLDAVEAPTVRALVVAALEERRDALGR